LPDLIAATLIAKSSAMTGGFFNPLSRRPKAGYSDATARLQAATRALLDLSDDVVISITELACREPGCPDLETVVAVMRAGERPCTAKIRKALPEVTADHLAAEFARLGWRIARARDTY
jgi:hypothetical protein